MCITLQSEHETLNAALKNVPTTPQGPHTLLVSASLALPFAASSPSKGQVWTQDSHPTTDTTNQWNPVPQFPTRTQRTEDHEKPKAGVARLA